MTAKIDPNAVLKTVQDAVQQSRANVETMVKGAQDAAQQGYDQVVAATQQQFQKASAEAAKGYEEVAKIQRDALDAVTESGLTIAKGAEEISKRAAAFTQANIEASMAHAKSLLAAKNANDVVDLQASYLRQAYDRLVSEMNGFQSLVVKVSNEAISPIQTRAQAAVTKFSAKKAA